MKVERKKLVYILHDIQIGGVEVALLSAIPMLREKYELTVVVLGKIDEKLSNYLTPAEKESFITFDFSLYSYPINIGRVVDYVVRLEPNLLVCSLWRASWVGIKIKRKLPQVRFFSFIHNTRFFHWPDAYFSKKAVWGADMVLVDSSAVLDFVRPIIGNDKVIKKVSFLTHPTPRENPSGQKARTFGTRNIRFLYMGSVTKVKNLPPAIEFISELSKRGYSVTLDFFGKKGDAFPAVDRYIGDLQLREYIKYQGEVSPFDRMSIFPRYDFYIQLSKFEGMAMSVAEAMQNGLVCIVTPVGEIPTYSKDGDSAIFWDDLDSSSKERALEKVGEMIDNGELYTRMSSKCHGNFLGKQTYEASLLDCLA